MPPWNAWLLFRDEPILEDRRAAAEAAEAVNDAWDHLGLPDGVQLLLFDLKTRNQARYVTMPVRLHIHEQDCGRC